MEEVTEFNFDLASWQDLNTEAKRLHSELQIAQNKMRYTETAFANRDRQYTAGRALIEEMISEEIITDEDYIKQLVEIFSIEIMKEVAFTITVELSGTVEIPMGSELDEYSFNVDSLSYDGEDVYFSHDNTDISGWNFTE